MNTTHEVTTAAQAAIKSAKRNETPLLVVKVRRDLREFGPKRTRTINPGLRSRLETYRNEQTRFAFAPTFVDELVEVAVIDESHGQFRLERASEQHLWVSHKDWRFDPTPTVVADSDEDGALTGRGVFTVTGLAAA